MGVLPKEKVEDILKVLSTFFCFRGRLNFILWLKKSIFSAQIFSFFRAVAPLWHSKKYQFEQKI